MFTLASGFYENYLVPPEVRLLIVGLDNGGKTTILERLKVTDFNNTKQAVSGKKISVKAVKDGQGNDRKIGYDKRERYAGESSRNMNVVKSNGNDNGNGTGNDQSQSANDDDDIVMKQAGYANGDDMRVLQNRRSSLCPAPRYNTSSSEDEEDQENYVFDGDSIIHQSEQELMTKNEMNDSTGSFSSISTNHSGIVRIPSAKVSSIPPIAPHPPISKNRTFEDHYYSNQDVNSSAPKVNPEVSKKKKKKTQQGQKSFDQKPGSKMFPLHLIRPTVGMNLAKFEACKAKVRVMDLGGSSKMRNLWERYYNGIHGVAFVVDVSRHASVAKLMEARAFYRCMLDDDLLKNVPILIFANKIDERSDGDNGSDIDGDNSSTASSTGEGTDDEHVNDGGLLGDTSLLDIAELFLSPPRGSRSLNIDLQRITMFAGSAKTGEGVRPAFEWLIRMGTFLATAQRRASIH